MGHADIYSLVIPGSIHSLSMGHLDDEGEEGAGDLSDRSGIISTSRTSRLCASMEISLGLNCRIFEVLSVSAKTLPL
jgi:hypothetical protein